MIPRSIRFVALAVALGALAGFDQQAAQVAPEQAASSVDEMSAHGTQVCPRRLPGDPTEDYGLGTNEPAPTAPSLAAPERAWVCGYAPVDTGQAKNGATYVWRRLGPARPVAVTELPGLAELLSGLVPADTDQACTDDLGPRWMLVYSSASDLTGVVVDDYGCGDTRLTDEPFLTAPGEASQRGTVAGVLRSPPELLERLRALGGD